LAVFKSIYGIKLLFKQYHTFRHIFGLFENCRFGFGAAKQGNNDSILSEYGCPTTVAPYLAQCLHYAGRRRNDVIGIKLGRNVQQQQ
jgi:hypothetical protein